MTDETLMNGVVVPSITAPGPQGVLMDLDKPRRMSINLWTIYQTEREWERRQGLKQGEDVLLRPLLLEPYAHIPVTKLILLAMYGLRHFDASVTFEQAATWFDYRVLDDVIVREMQADHRPADSAPTVGETLPFQEGLTLVLDKPYRYRLSFWAEYCAAREYEQLFELRPESVQVADLVADYLHTSHLLVLVRNGLRATLAAPPLTLEQVGRAMPFYKVLPVVKIVDEAWIAAHPPQPEQPPQTEEPSPESPPSWTGATAGAAPASTSG